MTESAANQKLEAVRAGLLEDAGGRLDRRTLGRMLANYAATRLREALEALVKAIDTGTGMDEAMAEARSWLKSYEKPEGTTSPEGE